jgi:hypothetical protein
MEYQPIENSDSWNINGCNGKTTFNIFVPTVYKLSDIHFNVYVSYTGVDSPGSGRDQWWTLMNVVMNLQVLVPEG